MRKYLILATIAVLAGLAYIACIKSGLIPFSNSTSSTLVSKAKDFFDQQHLSLASTASATPGGQFNPLTALDRTVAWDAAYVQKVSTGTEIVVPINFKHALNAGGGVFRNRARTSANSMYRLILGRDANGDFSSVRILAMYPDSTYLHDGSPFQGLAIASDWTGKFMYGYQFKAGSTLKIAAPKATPNSRVTPTSDPVTVCSYIDWYSCTETDCTYLYTEDLGCVTYDDGGGASGTVSDTDLQEEAGGGSGEGTGTEGTYSSDDGGPTTPAYLCNKSYNWGVVGDANYTTLTDVSFDLVNINDGSIYYYPIYNSCVHFSTTISQSDATATFNAAWTSAMNRVIRDANTKWILGELFVLTNLSKYINQYLYGKYGSAAVFNLQGCSGTGIPTSTASWCNTPQT